MIKNILITGANGKIASAVIDELLQQHHNLFLFSRDKTGLEQKYKNYGNVKAFAYDELDTLQSNIDIVLHCAFARSQNGKELADSIVCASCIFKYAVLHSIPKVIHISSQSIYGIFRQTPSVETDIAEPSDKYAVAKYACEKIGVLVSEESNTQITHIRLASLIAPEFPERIVNKMIDDAKLKHQINIVGGEQVFSFLDLRDAVSGITALIDNCDKKWDEVYNLSSWNYSISQIAETIKSYIEKKPNNGLVEVFVEKKNLDYQIRLNSDKFMHEFNWQPKYTLEDTVAQIYDALYD